MPDARDLPLFRWGEELRRFRLSRRAHRLRTFGAIGGTLMVVLLLASLIWPPRPLLLWNASPSSPIGLYGVSAADELKPGMRVVAWPPPRARQLADERRYLPAGVPLVKRVAAVAGERVCAIGEAIFVNGRLEARRAGLDGAGRPLPWWTGCIVLENGQVFLLSASASSFDGRYFGATRRSEVVGQAWLLWAS